MKKKCIILGCVNFIILSLIMIGKVTGYPVWQSTVDYIKTPNVDRPKIAITFDDGPNEKYTPMLLDGLKERGVKATFFIIGNKIEGNEELVKRIHDEGHIIGNHTYSHVQLSRLSREQVCRELEMACDKIYEVTGEYPEYVRAPFGVWNEKFEYYVEMFPVSWTIDPFDWRTSNEDLVVQRIVKKAKDNGIILLHDNYESSVKAALRSIDILKKEGYDFVTVGDIILE